MTINQFMEANTGRIIDEIINNLENQFTSHQFIEKFSQLFERNYIEFLYEYRNNNEAFRTVHSQIARYLSEHGRNFGIRKESRSTDQNIFGECTDNQSWIRI